MLVFVGCVFVILIVDDWKWWGENDDILSDLGGKLYEVECRVMREFIGSLICDWGYIFFWYL